MQLARFHILSFKILRDEIEITETVTEYPILTADYKAR